MCVLSPSLHHKDHDRSSESQHAFSLLTFAVSDNPRTTSYGVYVSQLMCLVMLLTSTLEIKF